MDRSLTADANTPLGSSTSPLSNPATSARIEGAARAAHETVDRVADKATTLGGAAHQAVDTTADAVASATEWASGIPEQAKQTQARMTEAACASIRARPIASVAGALVVGYLIGRLARLNQR